MSKANRTPEELPEFSDAREPQRETELELSGEPEGELAPSMSSDPVAVEAEQSYDLQEPDPQGLQPLPAPEPDEHSGSTKLGRLWTATVISVLLLILLIIFIAQNQNPVTVQYFGMRGEISLGLALFIAALGGALIVAAIGAARVIQLRASARKKRRAEKKNSAF
ncbi:lipopolysaccharide assembly LapA domain-containing protein [Glutamicibacter sp. NPDC087344]|uniref:LapA family protein n=1 Tax=Glutamicibacter sp. NPDC087344 TaxID=3363994 RepID=UPI0037FB84E5